MRKTTTTLMVVVFFNFKMYHEEGNVYESESVCRRETTFYETAVA